MAVGMIRPDGGTVLVNGDEITEDPMYLRARKGLGYLPQESSVFRKLNVYENIAAILEIRSLSASEIDLRTCSLMEELGITHLAGRRAQLLSGGERRRVEIARALAGEPSFMLLDEPFAGIDPLAVIDIQKIVRQLAARGIGVLISDHNVRETLGVCASAYILNEGRVIASGKPENITGDETVRRIYLGENFRL
jgi:lipopolysaccharide export system ATP-binding protein